MKNCPLNGNTCEEHKCIYVIEKDKEMYLCSSCFSQLYTKKCPNCQITIEEINEKHKLGCGNCYEFYKNEIKILLQIVHGQTQHIGKQSLKSLSDDILKEILYKKVKLEEYEEAQKIKIILENRVKTD